MVINRQKRIRVAASSLEEFLVRVTRLLELPHSAATVCLVRDAQIAKWNAQYRGKSGPTDVLSFPSGNGSGGNSARRVRAAASRLRGSLQEAEEANLGDIAIAPAVAQRNARSAGRTLEEELRALILHGVLHLMGYDHETDHGEMERLERRLRRRLGLP